MAQERFAVREHPRESRYVLIDHGEDGTGEAVIGEEAYADTPDAHERILYHTFVDETYAGQGLASVLVRAAVEDVIGRGAAVVPVCPYVKAWLPKHPEYAEHVVQPAAQHLRAVRAATEGGK